MAVLIGALLTILVIAVVVYPFIKARFAGWPSPTTDSPSRTDRGSSSEPGGLPEPADREAIYEEIKTLRLEYELGSVEEKEYQERLRAYRLQAAATLRDQEMLEQGLDLSLEDEILAARQLRGNERDPSPCRSCGRPLTKRDVVCSHCGARADSGKPGQRGG